MACTLELRANAEIRTFRYDSKNGNTPRPGRIGRFGGTNDKPYDDLMHD